MLVPAPAQVDRFRRDLEALTGHVPGRLAVAVSGGPDSLALLLLAAAAYPGAIEVATVDHGLRPQSADEARFVAGICERLGARHATLAARVDTARASLQRSAREARYAALAGWLAESGTLWLATAHHGDDQAETVMMRLARGSGVAGLAGIRARAPLPASGSSARLVRPLLGWRRAELAAIVAAAGLTPVDDPSNRDDRFDRARLRRRLAQSDWIDAEPLARSAAALAEADAALDWIVDRLWSERVTEADAGFTLDPAGLPSELERRLLLRILKRLAPAAVPRGDEVQRLAESLAIGATATLCEVKGSGGALWHFEPAPPRRPRLGRS